MMNKVVFTVGVLANIFVLLFGKDVIGLIFGESQGDASYYLFIMSFSIPLFFLASAMGALLTTGGHLRNKIKIQTVVAILNVALNIIFVPKYGAIAAALLVNVTNIILIIGYGCYIYLGVYKGLSLRKKDYLILGLQLVILCIPLLYGRVDSFFFKSIEFIVGFLVMALLGFFWINQKEKEELQGLIK